MVQIYCGDGKGKTTAAVGLAVRAAGNGLPVLFAQFLKDDSSGEIAVLKQIDGVTVLHPEVHFGFIKNMTEEQLAETKAAYTRLLHEIETRLQHIEDDKKNERPQSIPCAVIILDEIIHACNFDLLSEEAVLSLIKRYADCAEFVLTGRNPSATMKEVADYISEVENLKHPYKKGITARRGIEY